MTGRMRNENGDQVDRFRDQGWGVGVEQRRGHRPRVWPVFLASGAQRAGMVVGGQGARGQPEPHNLQ